MKYNVKLKIITPIIVHNGDFYDCLEVLPFEDKNEKSIVIIKPENIFSNTEDIRIKNLLSDLEKGFLEKVRKDLIEILKNHKDLTNKNGFVGKFFDDLEKNPHSVIYKIFKNPVYNKPYIPGSTIKGAIRTALLESLKSKNKFSFGKNVLKDSVRDYEMKIIENDKNAKQNIKNDPFRFLKVSDFIINDTKTYFGTIRIVNKNGEGKGVPIYTEMSNALYFAKKIVEAEGTITIDDNQKLVWFDSKFVNEKKESDKIEKTYKDKEIFTIENIISSINDFYIKIAKTERHNNIAGIEKLIKDNFYEKEALLRIGRFTQIESKTFKVKRSDEFYPNIKNKPLPDDININGGDSRALIDGSLPAGWCILSVEEYDKKQNIDFKEKIDEKYGDIETISIINSKDHNKNNANNTNSNYNNTYKNQNNNVDSKKNTNTNVKSFSHKRDYNDGDIVEIKILKVSSPFSEAETLDKHIKGFIHISMLSDRRVQNPDEIIKVGEIRKAVVKYRYDEKNNKEYLNFSLKKQDLDKANVKKYMVE